MLSVGAFVGVYALHHRYRSSKANATATKSSKSKKSSLSTGSSSSSSVYVPPSKPLTFLKPVPSDIEVSQVATPASMSEIADSIGTRGIHIALIYV